MVDDDRCTAWHSLLHDAAFQRNTISKACQGPLYAIFHKVTLSATHKRQFYQLHTEIFQSMLPRMLKPKNIMNSLNIMA